MTKRIASVAATILVVLSSCCSEQDLELVSESETPQEECFTIPIETALASLEQFMVDNNLVKTKGDFSTCIDNYFTVSNPLTKSVGKDINVLYAVNFTDNNGYALLSADKRIIEDIIAISDAGSVSQSDFEEPDLSVIPSDNDDLSESEYEEMIAKGVLAIQTGQINRECMLYACNKLKSKDQLDASVPNDNTGGGSCSFPESFKWMTVKEVPRMINTAWAQSTDNNDIFNKYCPEVGLIWRKKAPAGCVCIAVSQIIAFHEYPSNLEDKNANLIIDYPSIKEIYSYADRWCEGDNNSREMLARFCINVGGWCDTKYHSIFGKDWGFSFPWSAKHCFEVYGYKNVSFDWGYDEKRVLQSIDNGCPVFMSAVAKAWSGHAWVVDGYINRDYVSDRGLVAESQTLLHCNWGWHGKCNGYFSSGIFHTDESVMEDGLSEEIEKEHYWGLFNTVVYDNPNE